MRPLHFVYWYNACCPLELHRSKRRGRGLFRRRLPAAALNCFQERIQNGTAPPLSCWHLIRYLNIGCHSGCLLLLLLDKDRRQSLRNREGIRVSGRRDAVGADGMGHTVIKAHG